MINDVMPPTPPKRRKPKTIQPMPKPAVAPLHEQAKAIEPSFKTPSEVAAEEAAKPYTPPKPLVSRHTPVKIPRASRWQRFIPQTKKQKVITAIVAGVLVLGGAGAVTWALTHKTAPSPRHITKRSIKKVVKPDPIYSTLSGLEITDASINQRTVTGVMIENSVDARPQSGLSEAGVVFEAVAEGGITRFLALFQDTAPANVGPIRSARPYYVQWNMGFDAAYAHVGGSPLALQNISEWGVKDMNQFYNGGSYHRTTDRAAPHNVYTGIATLNQLESTKGFTSNFTGFTRKTDKPYKAPAQANNSGSTQSSTPTDARTPANSIDFSLSGYTYDPHYDYNASTNTYNRREAGQPHMDANTNKQIDPKVVIALVVPLAAGAQTSSGGYYSDYNVIGTGQAYIFQDGTITEAQWHKGSNAENISFTDSAGAPLPLNRGQTWLSAVSASTKVTYK